MTSLPSSPRAGTAAPVAIGRRIGRIAIRSLYAELSLSPKPGLVSPLDNGAHRDMTMATFMRSLFALRAYFAEIAAAGCDGAGFSDLQRLGMAAESRMLSATGGINTHRGAIFNLGFLSAAAGHLASRGRHAEPSAVAETVALRWGADILSSAPGAPRSHGLRAIARHGGTGARGQAAAGYPTVIAVALPALEDAVSGGAEREAALVQALFAILAVLDDTNLLHRGGAEGLAFVQREAAAFLAEGGVLAEDWRGRALALHRACIARNLSPGGAADLLAATLFLHDLDRAS